MTIIDRILTVIVTATLTSALWIVAGGSVLEMADSDSQRAVTRPAEAAPSPRPEGAPIVTETQIVDVAQPPSTAALDSEVASVPERAETSGLIVPVLNIRPGDLTDTFSNERVSGSRLHEAIDIMAPNGTTVVAAAPGKIEKIFRSDAGGKTIYVRSHDGKTIYYYAHLGKYAEGLTEDQRIRRGQRLGTVGATGNASPDSPHLHFAIFRTTADAQWWEPANAVNPFPLLTDRQP